MRRSKRLLVLVSASLLYSVLTIAQESPPDATATAPAPDAPTDTAAAESKPAVNDAAKTDPTLPPDDLPSERQAETPPPPNAGDGSLPAALLREERFEVQGASATTPQIQSEDLETDYPAQKEIVAPKAEGEDDFLFGAQRRFESLLTSSVPLQEKYRPTHRFGIWGAYTTSVLSKALYRSSEDSGLIDAISDAGLGLGMQMDFSWVEDPLSPQPSNSSLRVRAGIFRSRLSINEDYLSAHDPGSMETTLNAFHMAFLLKNALILSEGLRTWAGGGVFMNYVLWTDRPRTASDVSSNILNSLAFGPLFAIGGDIEIGKDSDLLVEVDYQLFKTWSAQIGMKTSL